MSKKNKTRIAFTSVLSIIPIVAFGKLNYISEGTGILLIIIAFILTFIFGQGYFEDLKKVKK